MTVIEQLAERALVRLGKVDPVAVLSHRLEQSTHRLVIQDTFKLLQTEMHYHEGLKWLCYLCEAPPEEPLLLELLHLCISSSRIFLYGDMLARKGAGLPEKLGLLDIAQRAYYALDGDTVLTKDQKDLYDRFKKVRHLVVSAPTSFGKSRIIREIIAHSDYACVAVVVPTNALLAETFFSFKNDHRLEQYEFVYSTHVEPVGGRAIYIFTPEKFDLYTDQYTLPVDFFVFDEVYKVGSEDDRASVFGSCLYKAYRMRCDYYLIGPYFDGFSQNFLKRTGGHFKKYVTNIVQKHELNYFSGKAIQFGETTLKGLQGKDGRLKQLLAKIDGQFLVYVSQKRSAESKAKFIAKEFPRTQESSSVKALCDYIRAGISEEWSLLTCLECGVGFHHAGVPKYIQSEIVDLFNEGLINDIVCTPTLIEGVNTAAKNVVFYDTTKADIDLSGFEVKNVIGRSGRFGVHFLGRAFFLEPHADEANIQEITFPIFDAETLTPEDSIQVGAEDLRGKALKQRKLIEKTASDMKVPLSLLKANKYVSVDSQLRLIAYLRAHSDIRDRLASIHGLPEKSQIDDMVTLIYEHLFTDKERSGNWTAGKLARFIKYQVYYAPSLKQLINQYDAASADTKIRNVLNLVYRYFEFLLPKYVLAFERIFNFVYGAELSLAVFVTHLQYGTTKTQDILLAEAGIPRSTISKISAHLEGVATIQDVRRRLDARPQIVKSLGPFEIKMLAKRL